MWRRRLPWAFVLTVTLATWPAAAEDAPAPILHEYFTLVRPAPRPDPLTEPSLTAPGEPAPVLAPGGQTLPGGNDPSRPGARNGPPTGLGDLTLDRDTEREGWLDYYAVFDPTVAPFKRMGVRDESVAERGELRLSVRDEGLRRVPVIAGEPSAEREVFWGSFTVDLRPGSYVPYPSVAPTQTVHRYETAPEVELELFRDSADNFYLRGRQEGLVRVNMLVSAPASYFGGELPEDGLERVPEWLVPTSPPEAEGPAAQIFAQLGLDEAGPPSEWVASLAAYFRAFSAEPFPEDERTESIYRDILFGGRGVCRHRVFAFVVTLHAWGIPARYVYNEAHAFSEVYLPGGGWRRIDLGGAAEGMNVRNASERVMHAPMSGDPLPEPSEYRDSYSAQARGEGPPQGGAQEGASARVDQAQAEQSARWDAFGDPGMSLADLPPPPGEEPVALPGAPATEPGAGAELDRAGLAGDPAGQGPMTDPGLDPAAAGADAGVDGVARAADSPPPPERAGVVLTVSYASTEAFRGESVVVAGQLSDGSGAGLAERDVAVWLGPPSGRRDGRVIRLGSITSDVDGRVRGSVPLPGSLPLGQWGIYLVFGGDEAFRAGRSE